MKHIVESIKSIPWIKIKAFCEYSDVSYNTFLGSIKYEEKGKHISSKQLEGLIDSVNLYHDIGSAFISNEKLSVNKISKYVNYEKLALSQQNKTLEKEITVLDHLEKYITDKLRNTKNKSISDLLDEESAPISPIKRLSTEPIEPLAQQKKIEPEPILSPINKNTEHTSPPKPTPTEKSLDQRISDFLNRRI